MSLAHYALTAGKTSETFTVGVPLVFMSFKGSHIQQVSSFTCWLGEGVVALLVICCI